jgi:hypothetical protein
MHTVPVSTVAPATVVYDVIIAVGVAAGVRIAVPQLQLLLKPLVLEQRGT